MGPPASSRSTTPTLDERRCPRGHLPTVDNMCVEGAPHEVSHKAAATDNDDFLYTVIVDKLCGDRLGIDVDSCDGETLLIEAVQEGGLVHSWNEQNPGRAVRMGDRILEVNGRRGVRD